MRYVLDSNVIIFYVRDPKTKAFIEDNYAPFSEKNTAVISIVSIAEVLSTARQHNWGEKKLKVVKKIIDSLVVVEVRFSDLIDAYIEIDTFSQGKLKEKPLKVSSRNMGKNDLWIAATTYVANAKLITADKDFDHLDGEYFDVIYIEREKKAKA